MALLAKLNLRAPLHVGSSTIGEEDTHDYVPSDTLFSALCHAYLGLFGREALEALLERFSEDPPFLISSAFPFCGETLFLPAPRVSPPPRAEQEERGAKKRLKGAPWLSLEDFSRVLGGGDVGGGGTETGRLLPRKELLPRVALDRRTSASSIYHVRRAVFPEGGGLWALLDVRDASLEDAIVAALRLLGDMGIGGERTMGCGHFDLETGPLPELLARHLRGAAPYVALSRVCPEPDEAGSAERYALVESKGWLLSPTGAQLKRRSVWFFAEGSSFGDKVRGRLVDVTPRYGPGHRVYRYGCGVYLGAA
ncbi:MAG: type III-A CRISPR-associated RAMP protein Csm4 [Actinomycetota bacterium]|nr:type III-A CRISPR-associated RAMP protein Csm4 [Actinomycetota bacterium]